MPAGARKAPLGSMFVSPAGDDANEGTATAPLRTIKAAVERARSTAAKTVALRAGTFREDTIWLGPDDHGLRLTSVDEEPAVVSGALLIEPQWTRYNGSSRVSYLSQRGCMTHARL